MKNSKTREGGKRLFGLFPKKHSNLGTRSPHAIQEKRETKFCDWIFLQYHYDASRVMIDGAVSVNLYMG